METLKDLLSNELCCCTLGVHCRPRGFSRLVLRVRFFLSRLSPLRRIPPRRRSFLFGCLVFFCLFLMRCNSLPKCNAVICDFPCPFTVSSNLFYEIFIQFCLASDSFNSVLHQIRSILSYIRFVQFCLASDSFNSVLHQILFFQVF